MFHFEARVQIDGMKGTVDTGLLTSCAGGEGATTELLDSERVRILRRMQDVAQLLPRLPEPLSKAVRRQSGLIAAVLLVHRFYGGAKGLERQCPPLPVEREGVVELEEVEGKPGRVPLIPADFPQP